MEKTYRNKDFYQAVILKTYGLNLVGLERGGEKFVTFVFDDQKALRECFKKNTGLEI